MLNRLSIKAKTFLYKSYLQSVIAYSYPIFPYLTDNRKDKFQSCQNLGIYQYIYNHLDPSDKPNSMAAHVELQLRSTAEMCYTRHKRFFTKLKENIPYWYDRLVEENSTAIHYLKNAKRTITPLQYAEGPRPQFKYSKNYVTG